MSLQVERTAADLSAIPANFQTHLQPEAPAPLKMMAAKGMLPLPPEQTITILYTIGLNEGGELKQVADQSLKDMPADIFLSALRGIKHQGMLDWLADLRTDDTTLEALFTNPSTAGLTVSRLAKRVSTKVADIIATNQMRLMETPEIIEQLYMNPNARAATVDRIVELAHRSGIKLKGIPGLNDALESGQDIFAGGVQAEDFEKVFEEDKRRAASQDRELKDDEEIDENLGRTLAAQINNMNIAQKIRLATVGSREAVHVLVRDSNKLVHMAAVRSPRVQYVDAKLWAHNKSMPDGVIQFISSNRDWTRHYEVQKSLVENPNTPLSDTLQFLNFMRTNDLKNLQNNRNIPMQVARQAKTLYVKRTSGAGKK